MTAARTLPTLTRGLRILTIVAHEGPIGAATIAARLATPIAAVRRVLATLAREGYCRRVPHSPLYAPTDRVAEIVARPRRDGLLTGIALDPIDELSRASDWPLIFATRCDATLIVRVSTMPIKGALLDRVLPGATGPLLHGAAGIAQAAFDTCASGGPVLAPLLLRDRLRMPALLDQVRRQGYCIHSGSAGQGALGVPVLVDGAAVAGLSMRFQMRLLGEQPLLAVHLPRLRLAAARIARSFVAAGPPHRAVSPVQTVKEKNLHVG